MEKPQFPPISITNLESYHGFVRVGPQGNVAPDHIITSMP
jgi:hypothetical protein